MTTGVLPMWRGRDVLGGLVTGLLDMTHRLRGGTREARARYVAGRRLRIQARRWDESQRTSYMLRQLHVAVRRTARETPLHATRFRAAGFDPSRDFTFDDFAQLPPLERD